MATAAPAATAGRPRGVATVAAPTGPQTPFVLTVEVTWDGALRDYVLLPPQVALPAGLTLHHTEAATSTAAGAARIDYRLWLVAARPGTYHVDAVTLRYTPAGAEAPYTLDLAGVDVEIPAAQRGGWVGALAAVAAALGTLPWAAVRARRRRAACRRAPAPGPDVDAAALLTRARAARMAGDLAAFVAAIVALGSEDPSPARRAALAALAEAVTYGGVVPPQADLDALERRAERHVAGLAPAPQSHAHSRMSPTGSAR